MTFQLATSKKSLHKQLVASTPSSRTVSYWRLGPMVTGGGWFELYRAAPKAMLDNDSYDYLIKLVNPNLHGPASEEALDRLGREAISTECLTHHGVIPLLDAELDSAPFFLVQPWIAGGSLDRFLATSNNMSLIKALWIVRQVAEAIDAAHQRGRVYLGLDPSHVLMAAAGRIVLIGWANSYSMAQPINFQKNRLQTVLYSAPECFEVGAIARKTSDVYSLGVFIYQLLVGHLPVSGVDSAAVLHAHQTTEPIDMIRHQPLCPARLNALVKHMLNKDSYARPTMSEVTEHLISIEIENLDNPAVIEL